MKLGLSVVAAQFLALAGTLPLSAQDIPASSVMPPGYLQAMPAADRVLSDMKVADSVETRARQYAAVFYLDEILDVLTWDHLYVQGGRSGLTPEEDSLRRGYGNAQNDLFSGSGKVPGLTALMTRYEAESSPLRSEILDRYFSPAWQAALMALDARYRVVENAPQTVRADRRAEKRARYLANLRNQFANKYGVQVFPNQNDLTTNPFNFEGKTVAIVVVLQQMSTATTGVFSRAGGGGHPDYVVSGIPTGTFHGPDYVVLAGRVVGRDAQNRLVQLKFIGMQPCGQERNERGVPDCVDWAAPRAL